jgi:DNA polymerase (family 10)
MKNHKVAEIFAAMADILAIQGESAYRIAAYRRAAENVATLGQPLVATLGQPLEDIWRAGELETIPGVGKTLAAKIDELMRTGCLEAYEKLGAQVPAGVVEMLQIPDVGPRKAALFWNELGTTSIEALEQAAREGRLRGIKGMGAKSEAKVLAGIGALKRRTGRTLLGVAWPLAYAMLGALQQVPGVVRAAPAGSMRRMRETVGDHSPRWPRYYSAAPPRPLSAPTRDCRWTCACWSRLAGARRSNISPAARPTTFTCGRWRSTGGSR